MAIAKKVLISYIVGGVGLAGGVTGLVIGLTKKPEEIIVPVPTPISGHTLTLHYGDKTKELPCQTSESLTEAPQIPSTWLEPHYVSQGWYSDSTYTSPITFPYDIQKDTDFYLKADIGMGKVYLHTDTNPYGTTYNGTDDWYHTEEYKDLGPGFAKRDEPVVENYKKRGWARVDTDTTGYWREPTFDDCLKDNQWPVYPEAGRIAHLYPMYELEKTTFTFRDENGKELLSPQTTSCAEGTVRTFQDPSAEDIKHFHFLGWAYSEDCKVIVNGKEVDRKAGALVGSDVTAGFIDASVKLVASVEQYQHGATFWLDKTGDETDMIWADMDHDGNATITSDAVAKLKTPVGATNEEFVYWVDETDTQVTWPVIIDDDETIFKPHFESASTVVHVDFDNANWVNEAGASQKANAVDINVMPSKNYSANELTDKARVAAGLGDDTTYHLVGTNGNLNNFYGWALNGSVETSFNFGDTPDQTIIAAFNNIDDITVTFNTAGGYFNYTNSYGDVESVTSLSMDINIPDWRAEHEGKVKVSDVYDVLLSDYAAELKRDGFKLNEGKIYGDNYGEYSGWIYMGNNLPKEFEITTSVSLFAEWIEKEATGNWWEDDWYTIAKLANEPAKNEGTITGTKLEEEYSEAFKGTDADGEAGGETKEANTFVGLTKTMEMPRLSAIDYELRVIGQAQDTTDDGDKALLTFDFVDCPVLGPSGFENYYVDDSASFHNSSSKSSVRSAMPEGLRNSLKTVVKYAINGKAGTSVLNEFKSDLFLLSTYEVNGDTSVSSSIEQEHSSEFFVYKYYDKTYVSDQGTNDVVNSYRIKRYNGVNVSWWTRTPAVYNKYGWRTTGAAEDNINNSWYVTYGESPKGPNSKPYDGGVWMYSCNQARGLSPAFCIGTYLGD